MMSDQKEKGVIAVEIALILPFLILLLLGSLDFGLLVHQHQVIQNAAREGARFSAQNQIGQHGITAADIQNRVVAYCAEQNVTIQAADVTVVQNRDYLVGTTLIRASEITVNHSRSMMTPGMSALLGDPVTIGARGVFRNFY